MHAKHTIIWLFVIILLATAAFATDSCIVGEQCVRVVQTQNNGIDTDYTQVNATIYYPNGTSYANLTGTKYATGWYRINFTTTNATGNYAIRWNIYNSTYGLVGQTGESFAVEEEGFMSGITGVIAFNNFTFIVAMFIVAIIALVLAYLLDEEHKWFRVLIYFFVVGIMVLIGAVTVKTDNTLSPIFYKSIVWLLGIFGFYLSVYVVIKMLQYFRNSVIR